VKVLLAILALVLAVPVVLVVGIALGPAILVIVFIAGFALIIAALTWLVESAKSRHERRTRIPPLHP
jgi:thiosulfate reductase cytochrome b subunit